MPLVRHGSFPKVYHETKTFKGANGIRLAGQDILRSMTVGGSSSSKVPSRGELIEEFFINPTKLNSGVLNKYASMYQKYKLHNFSVHYETEISALAGGAFLMCPVEDPTERPTHPDGEVNLRFAASKGATTVRYADNKTITFPRGAFEVERLVRSDGISPETTDSGRLFVFAQGGVTGDPYSTVAANYTGVIYITYDISFWDLILDDENSDHDSGVCYIEFDTAVAATSGQISGVNITTGFEEQYLHGMMDGGLFAVLVEDFVDPTAGPSAQALRYDGISEGTQCYISLVQTVELDGPEEVATMAFYLFSSLATMLTNTAVRNLAADAIAVGTQIVGEYIRVSDDRLEAAANQLAAAGQYYQISDEYKKYVHSSLVPDEEVVVEKTLKTLSPHSFRKY